MSVINSLDKIPLIISGESNIISKLIFFTAVIVIYSVFIFYFYKFLAKKNIIDLNLRKYNNTENPSLTKFFAGVFYIIEYIVILPIITFFWFGVLSILVLVLAKTLTLQTVLLISASLVASVRFTSYISEQLSQDLAKMLPFILLGIAITDPSFFMLNPLLERIIQIPSLLTQIPLYLLFIVIVELFMRTISLIEQAFKKDEEDETSEEE